MIPGFAIRNPKGVLEGVEVPAGPSIVNDKSPSKPSTYQ